MYAFGGAKGDLKRGYVYLRTQKNLHIHQKHYDKECGVFGMVKIKFLEVKL